MLGLLILVGIAGWAAGFFGLFEKRRVIFIALGAFAMGCAVLGILTSPDFRAVLNLPAWAIALAVTVNAVFGGGFAARMLSMNAPHESEESK